MGLDKQSSSRPRLDEYRRALGELLWSAISRFVATPLTWVVPRKSQLWLVMGREHGLYLDNAKYFHAWLQGNASLDLRFLGEREETLRRLGAAGVATLRYPGWKAFAALLRAGTVVVDTTDFIEHGRVGFLRGARIVQLWHGAPLKEIELALHRRRLERLRPSRRALVSFHKRVLSRYAAFDVLVSTSRFITERAFSKCFEARRILDSGYPRNDVILGSEDYPPGLVQLNMDESALSALEKHRSSGGRVVLYAPTFRHDRHSPFSSGRVPLDTLANFAAARHVLLALKLHPLIANCYSAEESGTLLDIDPHTDIYPLLKYVDVLITDYSSIYFDYLLLDRPVIFYPYDYEDYTTTDRHLLFDYEEMTPGPKVRDVDTLLARLEEVLTDGGEAWRAERTRVRSLVHDHVDAGASRRLWQALQQGS